LRYVYSQLGIELENERDILRLVQYASLHNQKPLTNDELIFIAKYPEEVEQILTVDPRRVDD